MIYKWVVADTVCVGMIMWWCYVVDSVVHFVVSYDPFPLNACLGDDLSFNHGDGT